jgi:UDP-glucose 4-epimerase
MAEQLIQSYARQFSVSSAIVRFFSVYGCGLRKQLLWDACCKLAGRNNDFQGTGREVRDWLHVEDAARLMLIAVERADPLCPIANGGSGVGLTVREILSHISIAMDVDGQEPRFSGEERGGDPCALVASICRAKEWGWSPEKPWRNEVGEYVAWWRHTGRYLAESPNGIDRQSLAG